MKIAVNARSLVKGQLDGVGRFAYESLKLITQKHPEHEFFFFFDRRFSYEFVFSPNIKPISLPPANIGPWTWKLWFDYQIPKALDKIKADIFVSPDGFLSLKTELPQHLVMHDISFVHNPQDFKPRRRRYFENTYPLFPSKATRIATVSEYSLNDISKTFKLPHDSIDVVYNGVSTVFTPLTDAEQTIVKTKYTQGCDFFVFVGTVSQPRKNLARLLRAFDKFKRNARSDYKLVIVGNQSNMCAEAKQSFNEIKFNTDVCFTGRLELKELRDLIGASFGMLYVPYFEGFGLPILEAMSCHVPVITSETTSMPEVGGDAAMYVDPFSVDSIKNAMVFLDESDGLRERLIQKGALQCKKFSWDKTADAYWNSIMKCIGI